MKIKDKCLGNLCYQGQVRTRVVDKTNRVLASYASHNGGTTKFFSGLAALLAGASTDVRAIRPKFIALYQLAKDETDPADTFDKLVNNKALRNVTSLIPLSSAVFNGSQSADLQLQIPFVNITGNSIYMFALFPESIADVNNSTEDVAETRLGEAIAYYKLIDAGKWSPISIDSSAIQNSLIIDWSLAFSDKGD